MLAFKYMLAFIGNYIAESSDLLRFLFSNDLLLVNSLEYLITALYAWLNKLAALTQLAHDSCVLELALIALQCFVNIFAIANINNQHRYI